MKKEAGRWREWGWREAEEGDIEQSLEFVAEMRILAEMKIKNHGNKYFLWEKINKHIFF